MAANEGYGWYGDSNREREKKKRNPAGHSSVRIINFRYEQKACAMCVKMQSFATMSMAMVSLLLFVCFVSIGVQKELLFKSVVFFFEFKLGDCNSLCKNRNKDWCN